MQNNEKRFEKQLKQQKLKKNYIPKMQKQQNF
jgi:hypothetical protein